MTSRFEPCLPFHDLERPYERALRYFEVLAYPGVDEREAGWKFQQALHAYYLWACRQQYGLKKLRDRGVLPVNKESWEGTLFRGGARIRRRINSYKIWRRLGVWVDEGCEKIPADLLDVVRNSRSSLRATILRNIAEAHNGLRLDSPRGQLGVDQEEIIRQLRRYVKESRCVLHMAWQLDLARNSVASSISPEIPRGERRSWRRAFLLSDDWIDQAIERAEHWRAAQEPHHPNGVAAADMISLGPIKCRRSLPHDY